MVNIGIIGAGCLGSELARKFCKSGHVVRFCNSRSPETLKDLADKIGAIACTPKDVIKRSNIIIIAIPEHAISTLPRRIFSQHLSSDAIIVDAGNYFPIRDGEIRAIDEGLADSEYVFMQFGCPIVKAFNNIWARNIRDCSLPAGHPQRIALPVTGDNQRAKLITMELIDSIGFDGVDGGPLYNSWRQQPGSLAFGTDHTKENLPALLQQVERKELRIRLDVLMSRMGSNMPQLSVKDCTQWCRTQAGESLNSVLTVYNRLDVNYRDPLRNHQQPKPALSFLASPNPFNAPTTALSRDAVK